MKKKNIILLSIFTIGVMLFLACKEHVTSVMLNKNELLLSLDDTEMLVATIHPYDATNQKVTWTSSKPYVATVTDKGLVTAIKDGQTIITATTKDGKKTATCSVIVDYRNKWVGKYMGEYVLRYYGTDNPHSDTTRDAIINVAVWNDSCLLITYYGQWKPIVNTDGFFGQYDNAGVNAVCEGVVLHDSIYFGGKLNKAYGHDFKGKKTSK